MAQIIAELCQNHNGDMVLLKEMVAAAAEGGATFCKIQSFFADDLSPAWAHEYDRIKALELSWDDHAEFVDYCRVYNLTPMTSVYSLEYAELVSRCGFDWVKIGSAQCLDLKLIMLYKSMGFKVIMSTGGTDVEDLHSLFPLECVMHCVSKYPHTPDESNLARLIPLARKFPKIPLGFSDHTDPTQKYWSNPTLMAHRLGVAFIEKHFTILPRDKTKDGPVSITLEQLKVLSAGCKLIPSFDGVAQSEHDLITRYRSRWEPKTYPKDY